MAQQEEIEITWKRVDEHGRMTRASFVKLFDNMVDASKIMEILMQIVKDFKPEE